MTIATVPVSLGDRSYEVRIGQGLIDAAGAAIAPFAPSRRVAIVTDETVEALHGARLRGALEAAGLTVKTVVVPPGEGTKSWAGLAQVCDALLAWNLERRDLVVAFGGGVIGDLAGLAAGLLKRGVDFVQIPTTLLAQVDSSVGGKTAIDTDYGKNTVGLFHQPRLVLADLDVLATLSRRERRAGYAEIVKYGLIDDAAFFAWCEANGAAVIDGEAGALAFAVRHSVEAKARVVAADEREAGARALLNLGHTFGHAIETVTGYATWLHGEAIGAGLAMAAHMSVAAGLMSAADSAHIERVLQTFGLRTSAAPEVAAAAARAAMNLDKKVQAGRVRFILLRGIGNAFVTADWPEDALAATLAARFA